MILSINNFFRINLTQIELALRGDLIQNWTRFIKHRHTY